MRTFTINVLAKFGSWCCQKAIQMADSGHIEFEVSIPQKQPLNIYFVQKPKKKIRFGWALLLLMVMGLVVWSVLTISFSIERSSDKLTYELQREHKEEMRNCFSKRPSIFRL